MLFKKRKTNITAWLFIMPALLVVVLLMLYPVISSVFYSFTNKNLVKPNFKFVGFDNYIRILNDAEFWSSFFNNLRWTFFSLAGQVLVGFTAALALNRIRRGAGIYRTLLIIPWAFPSIVLAFSWKWILNGVYGFLPNVLVKLGLCEGPPEFLSGSRLVFPTPVLINIWFGAPLIMVNVLSALQTVPKDQYEAAQIDGANPWQALVRIKLPMVMSSVTICLFLSLTNSFKLFDQNLSLTGGEPNHASEMLALNIYNTFYTRSGPQWKGIGQAKAVIFFVLVVAIALVQLRATRSREVQQ